VTRPRFHPDRFRNTLPDDDVSVKNLAPRLVLLLSAMTIVAEAQEPMPRVTPVTQRSETYPSLSPDRRFLIYSSNADGGLSLYRLDLTTRAVLRLTSGDFEDSAASWSPDGRRIVFQREDPGGDRDLWEIDADGSRPRNLTNTPGLQEQHPRYAPDGSAIIFDSNRPDSGKGKLPAATENYEIYIMSLKGGALSRVTDWPRWDMYPSFSPDGGRVAWRRAMPGAQREEQNFEIFVKELRNGREMNLSNNPGHDGNPHWSPTGEWIVFVSSRTGSSDIFVVRPDGSGLRQLTTGAGRSLGYSRPSFSYDGTRIVANRTIAGVTDMVILELQTGR
jgi:TolB protein